MKKWWMVLLLTAGLVFLINYASALSNPSAVYCENLGYVYETNHTANGYIGICVASGNVKLDAWSFFEGKTGQRYSYCTREGYQTQASNDGKNPYSENYTVCVNNAIKVNKSADKLMNLSGKLNDDVQSDKKPASFFSSALDSISSFTGNSVSSGSLPSYFDWRNYDNASWLTPVKNQGSCGSCWAFATIGGVEAKIKIARNDSNFDADLSEQDLVSCGVPYGFYPGGEGGCEGATLEDPLNYTRDSGVTDEACFPYSGSDEGCADKCITSGIRNWKIDSYDYVPFGQIKNYLVEKGPLITGIYMAGNFVNGVYKCSNPGDNLNHAVVIVGYNDTGNYWIVKNSWGSNWNGDGYFKVGYGQCNIEVTPIFLNLEINSTQKINVENVSINSGIAKGNLTNTNEKDNLFFDYRCSDNESNCTYDIENLFQTNLSHIVSLNVITYQNSSDGQANFSYLNNDSWNSLGMISQTPYLIKYSLCNSGMECSSLISAGSLLLKYFGQGSTSVDSLYLEAQTYCTDNWTLNETWSDCSVNDTQYRNYYDANECYKNISLLNETETRSCDYCTPNWTADEICNSDNSSTTWYHDNNSCFPKTNLSSDLEGMPENQTTSNGCLNETQINETGNSSNSTAENTSFCGDTICDSNEDCNSCASDCRACASETPAPNPAPSGGGGGSTSTNTITSKTIANTTNSTNINSNSQQINTSGNPMPIESAVSEETGKQIKQPLSLTGLMVAIQNNLAARVVLIFVIGISATALLFLQRKKIFSRKQMHKEMVKIGRKRK